MKKLSDNQGIMAMGSMVIVMGTLLTSGVAGAMILSTTQTTANRAAAVADDTVANLCDGLIVIDATGHYTNNSLVSLQYLMKTSPGSDPINMANVTILVTTETNETAYTLDNGANIFQTHIFSGDNNTIVSRGELLQLTIPGLNLPVGEDLIVKLVPEMGQTLTMSFTVPDSLGNEFVEFDQ